MWEFESGLGLVRDETRVRHEGRLPTTAGFNALAENPARLCGKCPDSGFSDRCIRHTHVAARAELMSLRKVT